MRRRIFTLLFVGLISLFGAALSYAEVSISALVDKKTVQIDDIVYLSITVSGVRTIDTAPTVSGGDAFDIVPSGSSSKMVVINGDISASIDFNYILEPKRAGTFNLTDIKIEHGGKVYKAAPIRIAVTKSNDSDKDIFVKAEVSNTSPYVNEQILYSIKFYTRIKVTEPTYGDLKFNNFIYKELGTPKRYEEIVDGSEYLVLESKIALFPQKPGELLLPPVRIMTEIIKTSRRRMRGLFSGGISEYKQKRLRTNEIRLNVKHLPEYSVKEVPFSGLIGKFDISDSLGKSSLNVGDSTTLTVTIHGVGNIEDAVTLPKVDNKDFKTYDDKPTEEIRATKGGLYGRRTFKRAFIPLQEGQIKIPLLKFSYFDTKKDDYVVLNTKEYTLNVSPSPEENLNLVELAGTTTTKEAVKIIGRDILPINTSLDSLRDVNIRVSNGLTVILSVLPAGIYFFVLLQVRRKEMYKSSESILRRKRAYKNFSRSVNNLNNMMQENDKDFYIQLLLDFKTYVGDRFNVLGKAMTSDELNKVLLDKNIDNEVIVEITGAMQKVEVANYASKGLSEEEKKGLMKTFLSIVKKIEKKS
jgi:hypothetical protein